MINKEISIIVDRVKVTGTLEATPECITVRIQSPFKHLKNSVRFSGSPVGDRRFSCNGKLSKDAVTRAEGMLRELYLAGRALKQDPDFLKRLRRFMHRYEEKASVIHRDRDEINKKYDAGKLSKKAHETKLAELQQSEHQNVIGRGVVFRQYADQLTRSSGGKADIQSVLEFSA